ATRATTASCRRAARPSAWCSRRTSVTSCPSTYCDPLMAVIDFEHRHVATNGITMHVAEAGPHDGRAVVLCHGFPECWYSWRHQLVALGEAGFHVVAPDQRGYGQTDMPSDVGEYTQLHLVGDIVGLLDALGAERATVIGHDW